GFSHGSVVETHCRRRGAGPSKAKSLTPGVDIAIAIENVVEFAGVKRGYWPSQAEPARAFGCSPGGGGGRVVLAQPRAFG
ncbi:MAG: hypothetical protein ACE5OQ_11635, partial [Woeseia sp.]